MKLLMITRKVDRTEHLAGFIYNWVKKLSENLEHLYVITWQQGDASGLPENVTVKQLPEVNKFLKIFYLKKYAWKLLKEVDGLFCHQMPIYTIIVGPLAKLRRKKIVSWYMHRQVDFRVKIMEKIADVILSASKKSFRLESKKLVITGHGIDTELFKPQQKISSDEINILTVGRISPTKDYESMIKALDILKGEGINNINLKIIGEAGLEKHESYLVALQEMIISTDLSAKIELLGSRPNTEIPRFLQQADIFINMSGTGSVDKAVLEAMASGCLALTANESFIEILPSELMVEQNKPKDLAKKIKSIISLSEDKKIKLQNDLRGIVVENHDLNKLVKKIINQFNSLTV